MGETQSSQIADVYHGLGLATCGEGSYNKAIAYHKISIDAINRYDDEHPHVAYYYEGIGNACRLKRKYKQSVYYYHKAIRSAASSLALQEFHTGIAKTYLEQLHYDSAIYHYQRSISANASDHSLLLSGNYQDPFYLTAFYGVAIVFDTRYQYQRQLRDLLTSFRHYQSCDSLIAATQHQYLNYSDRVAFSKIAKQVYEDAIRVSLELAKNVFVLSYPTATQSVGFLPTPSQQDSIYYTQQAFYFAERAKAGSLTLALTDRRAKHFAGVPDSLLAQEKHLKQERSFYQTQRQEALGAGDDTLRRQHDDRLFTLNRRYDSLVAALEQQYPRYHQLKYTTTVRSPRQVQHRLDERTALLEYVISDTVGYVFSITRHRDTVHTFAVDSTLHQQLRTLTQTFSPGANPTDTVGTDCIGADCIGAYEIYRRILYDVLASLPPSVDRLVVVPDGPLSYLPFDMLPTAPVRDRNYRSWPYLLRRYAVSYAYSATLRWPDQAPPSMTPPTTYAAQLSENVAPRVLALAPAYEAVVRDTVAQRALGEWRDAVVPLAWNQHEVQGLRQYLSGTFVAGTQAQEALFKQQAASHEVVHLAAHALLDEDDPMQSRLVFSAPTDSTEDGFLHAYELYGMDLPARLAVLSACHTGAGQLAEGEGLLSLARAFAYAGCPSVIMNGGAAHDATTSRIMDRLYHYLAEGYDKAEALRQAKLDFLDQATAHTQLPAYWGGWMVVGDTTPLVSPSASYGWAWIGLTMLGVLLGGWWMKNHSLRFKP